MALHLGSVTIDVNPDDEYVKGGDFYLSILDNSIFEGLDNSDGKFLDYVDGEYIPVKSQKPIDRKRQLECCIEASSALYYQFQEEYKKLYGGEYNGRK